MQEFHSLKELTTNRAVTPQNIRHSGVLSQYALSGSSLDSKPLNSKPLEKKSLDNSSLGKHSLKNNVLSIDTLLQRPDIWRGSEDAHRLGTQNIQSIPSGHPHLDEQLHHQGWPGKALTELFCEQPGIGELSLLAPALSKLSQNKRWIFLVDPPYEPSAPALEQMGIVLNRLIIVRTESSEQYTWVCEQILRSPSYGALLAWEPNKRLSQRKIRKLQLASRANFGLAVLLRSQKQAQYPSFSALRIGLKLNRQQYLLDILKQPGGWAGQRVELPRSAALTEPAPGATELPVHLPVYVPDYTSPEPTKRNRNNAARRSLKAELTIPEMPEIQQHRARHFSQTTL